MTELESQSRLPRFSLFQKIVMGIAGLVMVIVIALLVSSRARSMAVRTGLSVAGAEPPRDAHGHTNVLLLGVGDENHDGADLTDTMMIASIDPGASQSVVLLSLPRDLLIESGRYLAAGRVNAVYANEKYRLMARENLTEEEASAQALDALSRELSDELDLPIHGIIKTDFTAFEQLVDALGGVDVEVKEHIVDYSYPISEGRVGTFEIDPGMQHLDGVTALRYARSRHASNDFDRSARQQQLLSAIAEKVRSLGRIGQLSFLSDLHKRLEGHVETTFSTSELLGLAQIGTTLSLDRIITMQINFGTGNDYLEAQPGGFVYSAPPELYEGASVLLPLPLPGKTPNWSQIRTFAQFLVYHRDHYLAKPMLQVVQAGAPNIQVYRLRNELLRYGFLVAETVKPELTQEEVSESFSGSMISYRGRHDDTAEFFGTLLQLPAIEGDDADLLTASGDVLLWLDEDFTFRPFQTLSGAVLDVK